MRANSLYDMLTADCTLTTMLLRNVLRICTWIHVYPPNLPEFIPEPVVGRGLPEKCEGSVVCAHIVSGGPYDFLLN